MPMISGINVKKNLRIQALEKNSAKFSEYCIYIYLGRLAALQIVNWKADNS